MKAVMPKIMFYVQHLLGIGHIKRASLLVKAWREYGLDVVVVSGGEPVPQFGFDGAELLQLTPIKAADAGFSELVDSDGAGLSEEFKSRRRDQLLQSFDRIRPDILVLESYPFGRRQLRWELDPLLETAKNRDPVPLIVSSVRDILQSRKPERIRETLVKLDRYFDQVMVHGDSDFIPLSESFPAARELGDKLCYSGYVTEPVDPDISPSADQGSGSSLDGENEVIVSAGGGAVGFSLMRAAIEAKAQSSLSQLTWRFLLGPNVSANHRRMLQQQVDANTLIEPIRSDFPALLSRCRLSISQAGYNTVMDILQARCAAVLVPFEGTAETEQISRTRRLQQLGLCAMLQESQLDGVRLAKAIDNALDCLRDRDRDRDGELAGGINLNGAANSALLLESLW
ncbi:MAG: glycosyltransferase, partial [Motiliproteus sp.]